MFRYRLRSALIALMLIMSIVIVFTALAGNLQPENPPAPTMNSLDEIYDMASAGASIADISTNLFGASSTGPSFMALSGIPGPDSFSTITDVHKILSFSQNIVFKKDTSRPTFSLMSITKNTNSASPQIFTKMLNGSQISKIEIYNTAENSSSLVATSKITIDNVKIVNISNNIKYRNTDKKYANIENLQLIYEKIKWEDFTTGTSTQWQLIVDDFMLW